MHKNGSWVIETVNLSRLFSPGDAVYIKNFGLDATSTRWLPGVISHSVGPASYMVKLSNGQETRRHVNHIRKQTIGC